MINIYLSGNSSSNISVIFIHGNSLDYHIFNNQFESELSREFVLAGIDLPGHGNSSTWDSYSFKLMAKEVCSFINQQFNKPYFIVAHSLGGHLAIQGLSGLKNLKGIILSGTPPLSSISDMQAAFNPGVGLKLYQESWTKEEFELIIRDFSAEYPDIIADGLKKSDPKFRKDLLNPIFLSDFKNEWIELKEAGIPVYLTGASNDYHINKVYINACMQQYALPNVSYHEMEKGGHLPFLNAPQIFNEFLKERVLNMVPLN